MGIEALSTEDRQRVRTFFDDGIKVMQEIDDLKGGLKDTAKALADELDIKPAILMKSLRVAFKASMDEEKETVGSVEELLELAGRL